MNDTTPEFQNKQMEIIFSKTPEQRMKMGFDMIDSVYKLVRNSIKTENPALNEREVVAEIFKRYYRNDFSPEELGLIADRIRNYVKS